MLESIKYKNPLATKNRLMIAKNIHKIPTISGPTSRRKLVNNLLSSGLSSVSNTYLMDLTHGPVRARKKSSQHSVNAKQEK